MADEASNGSSTLHARVQMLNEHDDRLGVLEQQVAEAIQLLGHLNTRTGQIANLTTLHNGALERIEKALRSLGRHLKRRDGGEAATEVRKAKVVRRVR